MWRRLRALAGRPGLLALCLLALACTANRMYRTVSVEEYPSYSLAFIEFDDQGELWAPSQLERALAYLERLNRAESGVALLLFAHGWNADASPKQERHEDSALYRYKAMLARLAAGLRQELPGQELPVMGIYLGWRGRVSSVPLVRQASFYNRRGAAERIAGATATAAIYRVLTTLRQNPASRSVLIGHSFGSMILEQALAQAVVGALLATPGEELIFPADLVVLLNPAGSASQTKQLVDILARNRLKTYRLDGDGNRFERPLLVSFTSESDRATRRYFPIGMRVKAANKKFRDYGPESCSPVANQRRLYTHTAGHLPALHSHEVSVSPKSSGVVPRSPPDRSIPTYLGYEERYDPVTQEIAFSFDGESDRFTVRRRPRALNDTPYWIMRVPPELIPNHSAVLTEDTFRLVESVLVLSATYDTDVATLVEREDGVRPVAVVPRPDGSAVFLDRGRGVYSVDRGSRRPVFLSCLTEALDPEDAIGFHVAGNLVYAVLRTDHGGFSDGRCDTEMYEFELHEGGYHRLVELRFDGSHCFAAAAVDLLERRVLLSLETDEGPELWVAELDDESPRPRKLLSLASRRAPNVLHLDSAGRRLFAARGDDGELWQIDGLGTESPRQHRLAYDVGWPTALAYGRAERRLYVADPTRGAIWALDCTDLCREPRAFLRSQALLSPTTLEVGLDGTVWLGDLAGQALMAVAPSGRIETKIESLSGARSRPLPE